MPLLYACDACGCEAFTVVVVEAAKEVRCRDCGSRLGRIGEVRKQPSTLDRQSPLSKLAVRVNRFADERTR